MSKISVGVAGCSGRVGRLVIAEVVKAEGCQLVAGTGSPGSVGIGEDAGTLAGLAPVGVTVSDDPAAMLRVCDVVIDFSRPAPTADHAELAAELGKPLVIGTTGLDDAEVDKVRRAAERTAIVWAANTSLGITLLMGLVERAARRLGPEWDIEIVELHHRGKLDAPSGTALGLGHAAAAGRGVELAAVSQRGRDGMTGARRDGDIGFAALRGGDAVGDHSVVFAGAGERLELTHRASNRAIYAKGAIQAARWAVGRPPGLYTMKDVLDL